MSIYPTRTATQVAVAGLVVLAAGIVVGEATVVAWGGAMLAALALARELGLPYREALVKNRYVGRTFIMPNESERRKSVRRKLNTIEEEFDGKDVLLVDDSIVRGNTSRQIVQLARAAGANRVVVGREAFRWERTPAAALPESRPTFTSPTTSIGCSR